ncbi:hypothetical protein TUSST3_24210 [Streptomyces sp. TUS-ST3]|nr:hypothetical protein TUSST3_24210 [Streptomyces sp. TUS-ST3]
MVLVVMSLKLSPKEADGQAPPRELLRPGHGRDVLPPLRMHKARPRSKNEVCLVCRRQRRFSVHRRVPCQAGLTLRQNGAGAAVRARRGRTGDGWGRKGQLITEGHSAR